MDTKSIKNIKFGGSEINRVMSNNEILWSGSLKPVYEFYDSEIGKNSNWSKGEHNCWYLSKFKGQYIVYLRKVSLNKDNPIGIIVADFFVPLPAIDAVNDYGRFVFLDILEIKKSEQIVFEHEGSNNTYKNYVFICPEKYNEDFEQKLKDFSNSLLGGIYVN